MFNNLSDFILDGLRNNMNRRELYFKALENFNYQKSYKNFSNYVTKIKRRYMDNTNDIQDPNSHLVSILRNRQYVSLDELSNKMSESKSSILKICNNLRKEGYEIIYFNDKIKLSFKEILETNSINRNLEDREIVFGVASDLHFGSKACQITALNEFCKICQDNDVKYIFSPGDLLAGHNVYPGQLFDIYAHGAAEQEESLLANLPEGFQWIVIGGNHDYSFIKSSGHNPLSVIQNYRDDIKYVGFDWARIPILKNVDLMMWHPSGGTPYSISYRLQKGVEQIAFNELRDICDKDDKQHTLRFILAGHLHIQLQAMFGPIFGIQSGTFEGTTNYLKRKGLFPSIGGWIIKACLGQDNKFKNFEAKFHLFEEIDEDWRNYSHSLDKKEQISKPLFE